jgi:lysophospholipid acyltransferase (LPLAT)-like uncharacterized protein
MKLRHPLIIRTTAMLLSWLLRAWIGTISVRAGASNGSSAKPDRINRRGIYLFWHEMLLMPTGQAGRGFAALVSRHADGELIAQTVRMMGGHLVRGSTNRSGLTALRGLMRAGRVQHLAITPDGPRGPRRVVQHGAVFLAAKTGMPLIPVGVGVRDCWRAGSWDRMALPKPGTVAVILLGESIVVPPELERDGLDQQLARVQAAMDDVQRRAETLATDRHAPLTPFSLDVQR